MKNILILLVFLTILVGSVQAENTFVFPPVEPIAETFQQSPETLSIANNITGVESLLPRNVEQPATQQPPPIALLVLFLCLVLIGTLFIRPATKNSQSH